MAAPGPRLGENMSVWFRTAAAVLLALTAGQTFAQTTHDVYLDLDSNPATGCDVVTPAGTVIGAEVRLRATVDGDPAQVQGVTRAACAGGTFGAGQAQTAGYPVGTNLGTGGADVIEFSTALAGLGDGGPARLIFVSGNGAGADLIEAAITLPGGVTPPEPVDPAIIPATGWFALLLLVGFTVWLVRRHPAFGSTFALLLMMGVGVAWAANFISDGQTNDWTGETPIATDASNDASDGSAEIDIGAVFAETENGRLFVRVDVRDLAPTDNTAPTLAAIGFSVDENAAASTAVGSVTGSDADAGQTLTYAITAGNTGNTFAIDADTGAIRVASATALDFETTTSFALTVTVTDDGEPPLSDSATITISLDDVNEAPQVDAQTFAVAENAANGTSVGAVAATDPDGSAPNATLSYAITAGNTGGAFAIDANSGVISVAATAAVTLANTPFALTVTVSDGGVPVQSDTAVITVNVGNEDDAPEFSQPTYAFAIDENSAAGAAVGSVVATDPDAGQTLTYGIASGNTDGAFALDPASGAISVANAAALDFETTPSFTLTVNVTDDGTTPLTDSASVTITLNDVNEAPVATDAAFAVVENSVAGTTVNTAPATDPDSSAPNATLTFAITAGNTGGAFAIDPANGLISVANAAAVTLANAPFALTVTVTDGGAPQLSDSATITIDVTDENDAPQFGQPAYAFQLDEHSVAGTAVGAVAATDPDVSQTLTYAIASGDPGGVFAIDGASGAISVADAAALDFEASPVFNLVVSVTDDGTPPLSGNATVAVTLNDVNEAPVANDAALVLAENSTNGTTVGSVVATDPDTTAPNNTLSYAITNGDAGGAFAIDGTGQITVANGSLLDFESTPPFALEITVTDGGALSDTAIVGVTLTDANEPPALADSARLVAENSAFGTPVGAPLGGTDPDTAAPNSTLGYAITSGDAGGVFAIDGAGQITVVDGSQLDFETTPPFALEVTVTDGGGLSDTATVSVTVTDANELPAFIGDPYAFSLAENTPGASSVGGVAANDVDVGQTLTFAIDSGNTDGAFAIDAGTGAITVANATALDFELNPSFELSVSVTDDHAIPASDIATVTITLSDINDAPTDIALSNSSVAEDAAVGTTVGLLGSTDQDAGDTHTYTLVAGAGDNDNASFQITGNTLQTAVLLDFEVQSSYTVRVRTTDSGSLFFEEAFAIVSTDANEPPSLIALGNTSIAENQPAATVVGLLSSTDPDAGDTHTYSLVAGVGDTGNGSFQIAGNALQASVSLDFETQTNYSVRIRSTDAGGLFVEQTFALVVTNTNEAPSTPTLDNNTLAEEQAAGTTVGNLGATDPDVGDIVGFALVAGVGDTDNGAFQIVGNQLRTNAVLDFETQSTYSVRVAASDGTLDTEAVFTINLTGVDEAPTAIALGNNVIDEALPSGTPVGQFTTTDEDIGDTHTYTLVAGVGSTDNASFQIVGNELRTAAVLDFDVQPSYSIRVRSTDSDTLFFEQTFTITLNNINEQPTVLALGANSVPENQPAGTGVGTLSTTDPDTGDTFTYTLVAGPGSADNASFQIAGNQLQTATSFNFEADASYDVRVRSTDSGALFVEQTFNIIVTNVNETPTLLALPDNAVDENQAVNTVVGTFNTTDPDTADTFTYTLVAGAGSADNASFNISGGQLRTSAVFDFEADDSYSIRVRSTDAGGLFVEQAFTIVIVNVPEPPTVQDHDFDAVGNTRLSVAPTLPTDPVSVNVAGSVLDGAADPEGGALTASLVSATAGAVVTINTNGSFTYVPPPGATVSDTFTFRVTDTDTLFADGTVTVDLTGQVWYVRNNAAAGGLGRSTDPFDTLSEAETASLANDIIFVFAGSGTSGGQNAGITLKNGQKLYGEFNGLTVAPFPQLVPSGARPLIGNTGGNGVTVTASAANPRTAIEIRGLSLSGSTNAIDVTSSDAVDVGVSIGNNIVTAATNEGIDINAGSSGTHTFELHDNQLTATGNALDLLRTNGTVRITRFNNNSVSGNSGAGGIVLAGPLTFDSTPGAPYNQVSGGTTVIGASGNGVGGAGMVLTNVSGDLAFTDLDIFADGGAALSVTGTGAVNVGAATGTRVTVSTGVASLVAVGGPGLLLNGLTADMQPATFSSTNSAGTGVSLTNVSDGTTASTISIPTGSTITNATGTDFAISGGNATVTYNGTINDDVGALITVSGATGDTIAFTGAISDGNDGDGSGISLTSNTGATIRFSGGLQLSTGANAAFTATGGGTVEVCDENPCNPGATGLNTNTLVTTTGTALNVANTTIGANRLEFRSISAGTAASGPTNGIVLNSTGTSGGLSVKGTGGAGTGGTLQRSSSAAISLTTTRSVSLAGLNITGPTTSDGINGNNVTHFSCDGCALTNVGATTAHEGMRFTQLAGNVSITNSTFTNAAHNSIYIQNTSGTLDSLLIDGNTFNANSAANGNHHLLIEGVTGTPVFSNIDITDNDFTAARSIGVQIAGNNDTSMPDVTVSDNAFVNNVLAVDASLVQGSNMTFNINNNAITTTVAAGSHALNSNQGIPSTGTVRGRFDTNTIGTAGVTGSGSPIGNGMRVIGNDNGSKQYLITNSIIRETRNGRGIEVVNRNGTGRMDATVTNNNVNTDALPANFPLSGILVQSNCVTTCNSLRADIATNTVAVPSGGCVFDLTGTCLALVETGASVCELLDRPPGGAATANAELIANNPGSSSTSASAACALTAVAPILPP